MNSTIDLSKRIRRIFILFVLGILISNALHAQRYFRPSKKVYLGVEANYGTRSLQLKSDIDAINKLIVMGNGVGFGLVAGGNAFRVRVQQAFFSSNSFVREKTKLTETNGGINIYPLQFVAKKPAMLRPYFITGIQMSNAKLYGSYVAEPVLIPVAKKECTCTCPQSSGGPPANPDAVGGRLSSPSSVVIAAGPEGPGDPPVADPDAPSSPTIPSGPGSPGDPPVANPDATTSSADETQPENLQEPERYLGKISTARATMGMGLEIKIPGRKRFVNFYGEVKYGQPLTSKTSNIAFRDTKVSGLLSIDVGISVGICK